MYTTATEKVECVYYAADNVVAYQVLTPMFAVFGGGPALITRCASMHSRFTSELRAARSVEPHGRPYWFHVAVVDDRAWHDRRETLTSSDAALTLIVFNDRLFGEGNLRPPRSGASLARGANWDTAALRVDLFVESVAVQRGEELVVRIGIDNASDRVVGLPLVLGSPVVLAAEHVESGRVTIIPHVTESSCIGPAIALFQPGQRIEVARTVKVRAQSLASENGVFTALDGDYMLTVVSLAHYGIATACRPIRIRIGSVGPGER